MPVLVRQIEALLVHGLVMRYSLGSIGVEIPPAARVPDEMAGFACPRRKPAALFSLKIAERRAVFPRSGGIFYSLSGSEVRYDYRGGRFTCFLRITRPRTPARKIVVDPAARTLCLSCRPARPPARPLDTQVFALALTALYSLLRQGVVLHAAGLKAGRGAFLLAGPSGAGKSTLSAYCARLGGVVVLNDEKTIVDREFRLYGTPWSGLAGLRSPESAPLKGIFFLEKGKRNEIRPLSGAAAFSILMQCLWAPYGYRRGMEFCVDFILDMLRRVPCYSFRFTKSPASARYLFRKIRRP